MHGAGKILVLDAERLNVGTGSWSISVDLRSATFKHVGDEVEKLKAGIDPALYDVSQ